METLITITMTEKEYENFKYERNAAGRERKARDELQEKYDRLAQMVSEALKEDKFGVIRISTQQRASILYDKVKDILR